MTIPIAYGPVGYVSSRREYLQWHNWQAHIGRYEVWIDIPRSVKHEQLNQVHTSWEETWKCPRR